MLMKNKKQKMYLSLPITGRGLKQVKDYAERVKRVWVAKGYDVITPFEVCPEDDLTYNQYLGRDIEALLGCDGIVLCYDWFQSKGCRAECSVAEVFKKKILTDNTVYEENQL